jgi:LmbE family N-acetylglucosaminyl deacetylase
MVSGPGSVLAVMAHPDDAELWAGGTLRSLAAAGADVTIALPRHDAQRDAEAAAGAGILGVTLRLLDAVTTATLHELLHEVRPEVLVTHLQDDVHADHRHVADTVLAALPHVVIATGRPCRVYSCDSYQHLDRYGRSPHLPVILDVTATWPTKMRALAAHASQPIADDFAPMADAIGRLHGGRIGSRYGEAFAPVPVLGRLPAATHL